MGRSNFDEKEAGTIIIRRLFPGDDGFALAIIQVHPGVAQYNSVSAPLLHRLRYFIALKHRIVIHLQSTRPILSTKNALEELSRQVFSLAEAYGIENALVDAKNRYCDTIRVHGSKSKKAGMDRRVEAQVKEASKGEELDDIERSKRKREVELKYNAEKGKGAGEKLHK